MKKYILALFVTLLLPFAPLTANAQMGPFLPSIQKEEGVKQEDIQKLIDTLQSDTDRKDLVNNLKLLLDEQAKNEAAPADEILPSLTEQLGVRGQISTAVKKYEKFLDKNAISSSLVHQSIGTMITLLLGIGLFLGVRKIAMRAIMGIEHLSEKIGIRLSRISFYTRVFQTVLKFLIVGVMTYTIAKIWDLEHVVSIFESSSMKSFLTSSITVLLVAICAALIWEAVGVYLSYILKQADDNNQTRVKTLLPLIRNIVLSVFALLFGLVIMSEMGLNVAPFLAGAGVIGVAVGFGAQSMVKDFLTGFTIVLEDIIRVGDVVSLGGCTGSVEQITLRKVQLRDFAGVVYTIPFSQITTIQNMTKNFSYYVMDVSVDYKHNTDDVIATLKEIDQDLRADAEFKTLILEPIEIVGVDRFADNAVVIKARIKTLPIKQWAVGREFNRRMKMAFDQKGIEIPFPQRVVKMIQSPPTVTAVSE
ncbi:MAG: hypothetical protein A3B66_05295 [Alphaproteobacteria bacterium RIFCSPHIGHO2_02_FULL_46_13]|nr:MAG: hypothetical protein A3B66_05295 [Alphaproteobacteria bacterium RIFCSPHIGHO2_02_FULL_46_13]